MFVHHLGGCRPTPLAHYLKALGVLRLVGAQMDPDGRGWWARDVFQLATVHSQERLEAFFLHDYVPTPMVAPWNGGSGFYPKDKPDGIHAIEKSQATRFSLFREAIAAGRGLTKGRPKAPKEQEKAALQRRCREVWRGPLSDWLDAALVINAAGEAKYPALLGTGGNDGRLDFTNNFMQRLAELFDTASKDGRPRSAAIAFLSSALWGNPVRGLLSDKAIGQFLPGGAGGANMTEGFAAASLVNPWDYVLMLEGAVQLHGSVVRRADMRELPQAAAPFAVLPSAAGYGSAARADESPRGEQWMPLWERPATAEEVNELFAEGRSQLGRGPATRPVDFARAVARLGVARGVCAFERYGYLERNGQANLAVPLGRWVVTPQPSQDLLDEIAPWVSSLRWIASDGVAPSSFTSASRRCEEAMLACCREGKSTPRWQELLMGLGAAERLAMASPKFSKDKGLRPLPRLSSGWLGTVDDGSAEIRLAAALASVHGGGSVAARGQGGAEAIRVHWLPIEAGSWPRFATGTSSVEVSPRQVCHGGDLERDCVALLRRRSVEASRDALGSLGLGSVGGVTATLTDVARFLSADLDDRRCLALALPLMALDWKSFHPSASAPALQRAPSEGTPAGIFALLRLAVPHHGFSMPEGEGGAEINVRLDPAVIEHLAAGNLERAVRAALRRLGAAGLRPKLRLGCGGPDLARRMAAAIAFPLSLSDLRWLARLATRPEAMPSITHEAAVASSTSEASSVRHVR